LKTVGQHPNITLRQFGRPDFVDKENPDPMDVRMAQEALDHAREIVVRGEHELVILDEVNVALAWKLIDLQDLLSLLGEKPEEVELVLTGRHAHPEVIAHADLVTEMREIKHPYQKGVTSRRGIDY
jgi:cob(I)alamin adenosyltransferase